MTIIMVTRIGEGIMDKLCWNTKLVTSTFEGRPEMPHGN
jgi:hypothetical protein